MARGREVLCRFEIEESITVFHISSCLIIETETGCCAQSIFCLHQDRLHYLSICINTIYTISCKIIYEKKDVNDLFLHLNFKKCYQNNTNKQKIITIRFFILNTF